MRARKTGAAIVNNGLPVRKNAGFRFVVSINFCRGVKRFPLIDDFSGLLPVKDHHGAVLGKILLKNPIIDIYSIPLLFFYIVLWLQVFTSACKSAVVFPVDGVPVVFPLSLKRVDFARCGLLALFPATLGAVCFSALLACVSMPKVGHIRKACTLSRSGAFA